ncbi:MAG TPA: metalloregulator ArsR/SmtB family transcription factor [Bacillota bacterium]
METAELAKVFKALANEQRLHLFKLLYEWSGLEDSPESGYVSCDGVEKCFTKACCSLDLSRSTISHHLKELQNSGLITFTRNGQCFVCKINTEVLNEIRNFLK